MNLDVKKKQKKEALFKAAFDLFSTKGIKSTSISDIANKAKIAKGTFYLYFKDKFDLRDKLVAEKAKRVLVDALEDTGVNKGDKKLSVEDEVILIVDSILERMKNEPNLLRFITKNLSWGIFQTMVLGSDDGEKMTFYDEYHSMLDKSGRKFRNPDLLLYMVVELISGCSYQVILQGTPVTLNELKPDLFQAIKDMIARQEIAEK